MSSGVSQWELSTLYNFNRKSAMIMGPSTTENKLTGIKLGIF